MNKNAIIIWIICFILIILFVLISIKTSQTNTLSQQPDTMPLVIKNEKVVLSAQDYDYPVQRVPSNVQLSMTIIGMALSEGYTQEEAELFVRIAEKESGMDPYAVGFYTMDDGTQFLGLFQIWTGHNCGNLFDVETNIKCAFKIQRSQGWEAWQVYTDKLV